MGKVLIITLARLNRATRKVADELRQHGLWCDRLREVPVALVPVGYAYGWQRYGGTGEICIPRVSLLRLHDFLTGNYIGLADVIRHEYAHAIADNHRRLFRSRRFTTAFGRPHESSTASKYDVAKHVSAYAATQAGEDYAETFMLFLRHRGVLPAQHTTATIGRKWHFIHDLCCAIRSGQSRW